MSPGVDVQPSAVDEEGGRAQTVGDNGVVAAVLFQKAPPLRFLNLQTVAKKKIRYFQSQRLAVFGL